MKKIKLLISCLFLSCLLFGCNKNIDTHADVSYQNDKITNSNKLTVADLYNYVTENQADAISKRIITAVMKEKLDLTNKDNKDLLDLYIKYLNNYFDENFVTNATYKYFGEFSEKLLVSYLKSESYDIKCGEGYNSGYLNNEKFTCDYTDYIEQEVNYDIYLKILKVNYIIEEKSELIDKNEARRIRYYTVERGSNDDSLNTLKDYVNDFVENVNSTETDAVKNIDDIVKIDKNDDLDEIEKQYGYLGTSTDSPSYDYLNKFTKCGEVRCSREEGLAYQKNIIMEKEYTTSDVVIKTNTSVLFESARKLLFSENINDYLYTIGDRTYLINPASYSETDKRPTDIILYEGTTSGGHSTTSKYYLVEVEVIDSTSEFKDQAIIAEMMLSKISDADILEDCFKNVDLEIFDKDIRENFIKKYGEYEIE